MRESGLTIIVLELELELVRVIRVQLSSDLSLDKHINVVDMLSASFNYYNYAASDALWMTTLSLHSFMRSSRAESIIAAVS